MYAYLLSFCFIAILIFFSRFKTSATSLFYLTSSIMAILNGEVPASMLRDVLVRRFVVGFWCDWWKTQNKRCLSLFWGAVAQKYPVLERSDFSFLAFFFLSFPSTSWTRFYTDCHGSCGGGSKLCCVTQQRVLGSACSCVIASAAVQSQQPEQVDECLQWGGQGGSLLQWCSASVQ